MRWIVAIFFVYLILPFVVWAQWSRDNDCPAFPQVRVNVVTSVADPVYDFSTGISELQSVASTVVHQVRMGWALGFTETQPLLEMDAPVDAALGTKGKFCARPRYVNVTLGTRNETTIIPREIAPESCGFREVMEHEEKHRDINRQVMRKYAAFAEQSFKDYFKNMPPVRAETYDEAAALQQNDLRLILDDVAVKMIADNAALQHDVDEPAEYQRLLHVCNGELADIVKRARDEQYAWRQ